MYKIQRSRSDASNVVVVTPLPIERARGDVSHTIEPIERARGDVLHTIELLPRSVSHKKPMLQDGARTFDHRRAVMSNDTVIFHKTKSQHSSARREKASQTLPSYLFSCKRRASVPIFCESLTRFELPAKCEGK